jgi:hypothetical protein
MSIIVGMNQIIRKTISVFAVLILIFVLSFLVFAEHVNAVDCGYVCPGCIKAFEATWGDCGVYRSWGHPTKAACQAVCTY